MKFKLVLFTALLITLPLVAVFVAPSPVAAAECTYKVSLTVTPNTVNPQDQDKPIKLQAAVETDRGPSVACDNFYKVVYYRADTNAEVGQGGQSLYSGSAAAATVTLQQLGLSSGSLRFYAKAISTADANHSAQSSQVTLTVSGATPTGDCEAYLFFKNEANPNGFTDYRTFLPADGAKISVVAEIKRCQGKAGVTKLKAGGEATFLKSYFVLNPTQNYSFTFATALKEEGKYDFYLDYTPNTNGTPTAYKHIQINISSTPTNTNTNANTPPRKPFDVTKIDFEATYGGLEPLINSKSIPDFFAAVLKVFFLGIAGWALVFIIVGAFRMVMSRGNTEALTAGKKTVTWAIMGFVVALLSYSIVAIVQTALGVQ